MRRAVLTVVAAAGVLAVAPAPALAHKHHRRHHARVHSHIRRIGDLSPSSPTTGSTSAPASSAGTVASFDDATGKLTITVPDSSTASGTSTLSGIVTKDTEIDCQSSAMSSTVQSDDQGGNSSGDDSGEQAGGNDQGEDGGAAQGDDQGEDQGATCTTADLTPGRSVLGAELRISSDGNVWDKVELGS